MLGEKEQKPLDIEAWRRHVWETRWPDVPYDDEGKESERQDQGSV
jgi:hypothetical protein